MSPLLRLSAVLVAALAAPSAVAGNGSNYLHLINGVDYFFGKTPPTGSFSGIWRCFPSEILHAPTLDLDPANALTFGTYATKLCAVHVAISASPGKVITFPTIALSSSAGDCEFLTTAGTVNFGVFSVAGLGSIVAGPLTGASGPAPAVHLLAGVGGFAVPNPAPHPGLIALLGLSLTSTLGAPVTVPEDESLVLWIQDDPAQAGAGTMQYWNGSLDERNLCSGYSFLLSAFAGAARAFVPAFEWAVGLGTLDATMTTAIRSTGPGPSSMNAHAAIQGFNPGFDPGSGSRTISITGGGLGSEFLGFAVYDEQSASGGNRFVGVNCMGIETTGQAACSSRGATFTTFPTGGPGGPVVSAAIPELPRSVGKIDACFAAVVCSGVWLASTNFATSPGSLNIPWFPAPAGNSGSNASGLDGGFVLTIPPSTSLIGLQLFFWSFNVDPTNTFLDHVANRGHSLTNGYDARLFP